MENPSYSIILYNDNTDSETIARWLQSGKKVIWFGNAAKGEELKREFSAFVKAFLLQVYTAGESLTKRIIDGKDADDFLCFLEKDCPAFNAAQYRVEHCQADAHIVVEASAGTGKTKVMVDRILYLMHTVPGLKLSEIYMITFTRDAAAQMNDRLQEELLTRYRLTRQQKYLRWMEQQSDMNISTIHSFAYNLLKIYGISEGFTEELAIRSFRYEKQELVKDVLNACLDENKSVVSQLGVPWYRACEIILDFWEKLSGLGITHEELKHLEWGDPLNEASASFARLLPEVLEQLDEAYMEKKRRENAVDVNDIMRDLQEVLKEGVLPQTDLSMKYLFLDEFQDSDLSQISIACILAKKLGAVLFAVGDVKQSIYRFRMARPELFMEKYQKYSTQDGEEQRIDLHKNFRSREEVLTGANKLFSCLMTRRMGGIVYDEDAALNPGAEYPETHGENRSELLLLDLEEDPEGAAEAEENERELEARMVGTKILEMVGKQEVYDKETGGMRKARFGDVVILLRTISGWAESFLKVLHTMGIPGYTGTRTGYFSSVEIQTVLSFLKILDNPRQDIALTAVLASPIGNFSSRELALVKSSGAEGDFYTVCRSYLDQGTDEKLKEKLMAFFDMLDEFRSWVPYLPMHELLWRIFDRTGYADYAAAMPGGEQRTANLRMLEEKAAAYEETSYRGLYNFVRYIENLRKAEIDYGEANIGGEEADTVNIMSIHKSKGLEFPIVFVCGLHKSFNRMDVRSRVILHPDLGLGCDYTDPVLRVRIPLLMKRFLQKKTDEDNLSEELRVLYVALTRAKEKLILTGVLKGTEKKLSLWNQNAPDEEGLSYTALSGAENCLDWIMPVVLSNSNGPFDLQFVTIEGLVKEEVKGQVSLQMAGERLLKRKTEEEEAPVKQAREEIERLFSWKYPFEAGRKSGGQLTVSELKKMGMEEEEAGTVLIDVPPEPLIPAFRKKDIPAKGAALGTIYHKILEKLDYGQVLNRPQIQAQIQALKIQGFLTEEEETSVDCGMILRFVRSSLGRRMKDAFLKESLYREQPFIIGVPAKEIKAEWNSEELVLVQGIIDVWFEEEDGLVLADYKTDYTIDPSGEELVQKYKTQLEYYRKALSQVTGKPVKEAWIYSFWLGKAISVRMLSEKVKETGVEISGR